ncbi:hypothetical protein HPB47_017942 [Ixodes persulcatus]|uniref:Uncharacterized protein n=1 Tax=Ixodes persulcatus TaxID=34615 RepID=A0AC60QP82_IXOPE|nr:hypothetical protein HPB47_017942 [Ixodes persulcatus]
MSVSDVARRIAAFEFASRASDLIFGNVYALPRVPRPSVRDRENPMERYNDGQFLARYRVTKETVRELLAMLPLQASADNRGLPLPPMLATPGDPAVLRCRGVSDCHGGPRQRVPAGSLPHGRDSPALRAALTALTVRINSPGGDDAEVYRNRKGVFSINVQPGRSASIVTACAALHNLACLRREPQPPPPPPPPVRRRVRNRRRARRPVHLPPVDAVEDTLTGIQTREIIIEKASRIKGTPKRCLTLFKQVAILTDTF